jgi:small GTP-binding protein
MLGDSGVGKTTFLYRFLEDKFDPNTKMTVGPEVYADFIEIKNEKIPIEIWDIGGVTRFRFLIPDFCKRLDGAILMFDLTRISTLDNIRDWVKYVRDTNPSAPILLVGAKLDLIEDIEVKEDYAISYLKPLNLSGYMKISSKTGENVDKVFDTLSKSILPIIAEVPEIKFDVGVKKNKYKKAIRNVIFEAIYKKLHLREIVKRTIEIFNEYKVEIDPKDIIRELEDLIKERLIRFNYRIGWHYGSRSDEDFFEKTEEVYKKQLKEALE